MSGPLWRGDTSRKIVKRIVVEGELVLQTPAHFGNGDTAEWVDMPLLVDPLDNRSPLLTGASIAGALRGYLREREEGYFNAAANQSASVRLFGSLKKDETGEQSPLIIEDALGQSSGIELRSGVSIDPKSRTAREKQLFNLQLWQAGTSFPLRFELLIREGDDAYFLQQSLATALAGFTDGSITLGARKRRGYGLAQVPAWRVKMYDLISSDGLLDWLEHGAKPLNHLQPGASIKDALTVQDFLRDNRNSFLLEAKFSIDGSLLVGSGGGKDDLGPDLVQLHAWQPNGERKPVISGTSLSGALRARALKIANTLANGNAIAENTVDEMFGPKIRSVQNAAASRVIVGEAVIEKARVDLVQNRVGIDRFTGGARDTALFNEQPVFGGADTLLKIKVKLLEPQEHEIGLLLLLLKDLWAGDLPLGGGASIGRGRLQGKTAELTRQQNHQEQRWQLTVDESKNLSITGGAREALERFVSALKEKLRKEDQNETKN